MPKSNVHRRGVPGVLPNPLAGDVRQMTADVMIKEDLYCYADTSKVFVEVGARTYGYMRTWGLYSIEKQEIVP